MLPDVQNVLSAAELASFVCARTFDGVSDSRASLCELRRN